LNDRHQCTRFKEGRPIKVRVVCKAAAEANPRISSAATLAVLEDKCNAFMESSANCRRSSRVKFKERERIIKAQSAQVNKSDKESNASGKNNNSLKSKRARETIAKLKKRKEAKEVAAIVCAQKSERALATEMMLKATSIESAARKKLLLITEKEAEIQQRNESIRSATSELEAINKEIKRSKEVLEECQQELRRKKELHRYYNKLSNSSSCDDITKLVGVIEGALIHLKGKHNCTKAKLLMEAIVSGQLFNGEASKILQERIRSYIRSLFRPWKLVKAADVAAVGAFKSSTINALRSVIDENKEDLFPSVSTVSRVRCLLDDYAFKMVGWERKMTRYGEVFFINYEKAFRLLLKACQLDEIAQTSSVKIALTVDGADLFKGRTHVATGIKITDERGIHPVSKQPLSMQNEENDIIRFVKVQSSEVCAIMIIADAVDKKELYEDVFKEYYEWGNSLRLHGLPESELGPKLMPFTVVYTNDLKATWYLTNKGGGCKNKTHFCHLCPCTKNELTSYSIGEERCSRCKKRGRLKCYHHRVCDTVSVKALLDDLEAQLGLYYERHGKHYKEIMKRSKLLTSHMQANKEQDPHHIDYVVPPLNDAKQKEYANFIARECLIRGLRIDQSSNYNEWRDMLRVSISMEKYLTFLENVRQWHEDGRDRVPIIEILELLVPCILHLENRVGEKLLTTILRKAIDLQNNGQKEHFLKAMQHTFQSKIFGSDNSPSQWKLRYEKGPGDGNITLESIQMRNNMARRCISSIDEIIEAAFMEGTEISHQLIEACTKYQEAMSLLTIHRDLSEDEIEHFQTLIDDFYEIWVDTFGSEGISNYIHMLGAGHVMYFLTEYKCLYLYSQQGWEALNGQIQTFIHQNSQRGGNNSSVNKGEKSYIYCLVRLVLRDLLWKTYQADSFFLDLERRGIKV